MHHSKKYVFCLLTILLLLVGWTMPLRAIEPIKQYTLRFGGKKQSDNSSVTLKRITLSNLSQGCDTTFTSTTFLLKVLPQLTGVETLDFTESMQVHLSSANPFVTTAEVEVALSSSAPLHLTLFGLDGRIQQRYDGQFEAGTHRFSVEAANAGTSFLNINNGKTQQTLKLIKLGGNNVAQISYVWSGKVKQFESQFPDGQTTILRAPTVQPFVYYEGDQLQLIGYADGLANSSLYDIPADDNDYTFLFNAPFYRIREHQIIPNKPSFVDVLFSVEDLNYNGVDNLSNEDFIIKEDGRSVGSSKESYAYIRKMNTVPYKIQTVLVLDNSRSLEVSDLVKMKAAAIKLINSKENNQEIAVYSFSEDVNLLQDFTTDKELLEQAVNNIQRGGSSTNLYGACITGVNKFSNHFSVDQINQGFLVVFTDGDDTRNPSSMLQDAINARGAKRVYMVGLGDLDVATLNQLANPGPYFPVSSTDELERVFLLIQQDIVHYANSFYWLNYMSPKRNTSNVTLQVEINGNPNTARDSYYQGNFSAADFEAATGGVYIDPYLNGNGKEGYAPGVVLTNKTIDKQTLSAVTYWAENMPSYVWTSSDDRIAQIKPIPQSFNKAELIFPAENNPGGTVTITVCDEANTDDDGKPYERSVQVWAYTVPKLTTAEVTGINRIEAVTGGLIIDNGGHPIINKGVLYGTSLTELSEVHRGSGDGDFSCNLTGLQPGTTYYVQAYARNQKGTGYGDVLSFKTVDAVVPTVTTGGVTNISATSASCAATVTYNGGLSITEQGVCWGTADNPTTDNSKAIGNNVNLTSLQPTTTYYVRAYAVNNAGTGYGEVKTFTTDMALPEVTTKPATDITLTSATVEGSIVDTGTPAYTEKGICYATTNNPTTDNNKLMATGSGAGDFSVNISGLTAGTSYYARAYAINAKGKVYGSQIYFRTLLPSSVTTGSISMTRDCSVTVNATITNGGNPTYTECGFVIAATANPTTADRKIPVSNVVATAFTGTITELSPLTTYHVRAYVINSLGTVYGDNVSFTTQRPVLVTTIAGSTQGYADGNGTNAKFSTPAGIAIDASGNLYVADHGNNKTRKVTPQGEVSSIVNGNGVIAYFKYPSDVAVDASGNLYVADGSYRIRKITPQGEVTTLAGSTEGYADGNGTDAKFVYPKAMAVDASGNVYVLDANEYVDAARIRKITPQGEVTTLAGSTRGNNDGNGTNAKFYNPYAIAIDVSGNLYVTDGKIIRKVTPQGDVTTIAGNRYISGHIDGNGPYAAFTTTTGIAVDISGNIYVADHSNLNNLIRKISPQGDVTTLAGSTFGYADGSGTEAMFRTPCTLAVDAIGNIYVADRGNYRIRKITYE